MTFVELLFVVGILFVIGGVLLTVLMSGQASYLSADTTLRVQEEARKALDQVGRELREAVNVSCDDDLFTPPPGSDCTSADRRMNFQLLWYDAANGTVHPGSGQANDGQVIHYAVLGTQLIRYLNNSYTGSTVTTCDPSANCRVIANNVNPNNVNPNKVQFAWDASTRTVTVRLEAMIQNPFLPGGRSGAGAIRTGWLETQVQLRNKDPS